MPPHSPASGNIPHGSEATRTFAGGAAGLTFLLPADTQREES